MNGNIQIERGKTFDTGRYYIDVTGKPRIIYKSVVDFGALPNTATKNVAHGLSVDPEFATVELLANDGTTSKKVAASIGATNVSVTTTANETAFSGLAIIEHIKV